MSDFKTKMHKIQICAPDPARGAYRAPLDPLTVFKGPLFKETGGEKRKGRGRGKEEAKGGERKKGEGEGVRPRTATEQASAL